MISRYESLIRMIYRFVTQANRQYPLKPRPSHKKRILVEEPYPDLCILVAFTGNGLVGHSIRSMQSVTTLKDMLDFVKVILNKHSPEEGQSVFYAFDAAPAEVANALSEAVSSHSDEHKAFLIPMMEPSANPVGDLLFDALHNVDRKPLDSNKNENIDGRIDDVLMKITPEMCRRYIKTAFGVDNE